MIYKDKSPKAGETRIIRRFAWFPTSITGTDNIVFLQCYRAEQVSRISVTRGYSYWATTKVTVPGKGPPP